jgi:hypothetical protein
MICEKCAREVRTVQCGACGSDVARLGCFCYNCGTELEKEHDEDAVVESSQAKGDEGCDIDFSTRVLCSDGTCIGVINDMGVCKVCGKPYAPES